MYCLDTYALVEISRDNPRFRKYQNLDIAIPNTTLAEFYWVLLRKYDEATANYWIKKLSVYSKDISLDLLIKAMQYKFKHKKKNLSFHDVVGYTYARENGLPFVIGDEQFRHVPGVEFRKK